MKRFIAHLVALLARLLSVVSSMASPAMRSGIASIVAWLMEQVSSERFAVTCENIQKAYPSWDSKRVRQCARASYHNFALCFVELLATPGLSTDYIDKQFDIEDAAFLHEHNFVSSPVILIAAHYGNWEWGVQVVARFLQRSVINIAKPQRNDGLDGFINSCRTTPLTRVVSMHDAARDIISQMRNAGIVGMLIDQAADPQRDVFVEFFGRPAVCFEAPASLALRYNATLVCAFAHREPSGRYTIRLQRIDIDDLREQSDASKLISQRCTSALEENIRLAPEQWSWQHRRWKYNPQDYN